MSYRKRKYTRKRQIRLTPEHDTLIRNVAQTHNVSWSEALRIIIESFVILSKGAREITFWEIIELSFPSLAKKLQASIETTQDIRRPNNSKVGMASGYAD